MPQHDTRGSSRLRRALHAAAPLAIVAITACGGGTTGPSVPADAFAFTALNRFDQAGADTTAAQTVTVKFDVFVTTAAATVDNLAKVQSMTITWPDGTTQTPIPATFTTIAGAQTAHGEVQNAQGLMAGTYTLTVNFSGGASFTREAQVDGHQMARPVIQAMTAAADSVRLSWTAPGQSADWRLYLWQGTTAGADADAVATSSKGHTSSAVPASGSVTYALAPASDYVLGLLLSDHTNQRMVYMPFTTQ
ncbi:MAG TPA: hypothetical protein VJ957_05405 [Longimicrobiales bacterium]|nr:hypothetical protein [Longimicrobiales bacterium]